MCARNGEPSIRAMTVSARSVGVFAVGGGAGSSMRSMLCATMAATTAPITSLITATAEVRSPGPAAMTTVPGIASRERLGRGPGHQRRNPRHARVDGTASGVVVGLDRRDHRTAGHQPHAFDRDVCQPQQAGARPVATVAATDRDQPAQRVLHGDGERLGATAAGQRQRRGGAAHPSGGPPMASRRPAECFVVLGRCPSAGRPHHDLPARPRRLQLHLARREVVVVVIFIVVVVADRGAIATHEAPQRRQGLDEIGDDLLALVAAHGASDRDEVVVGGVDQPVEHPDRCRLVGGKQGLVGVAATAVDNRPDRRFDLLELNHRCPSRAGRGLS